MTNTDIDAGHSRTIEPSTFSERLAAEDQARRKIATPGLVYIVAGDHPAAVKIGFTTKLHSRLAHLQTGMATDIFLCACFEGTVFDELDLHARFATDRMRGEWFRLSKRVRGKIESLRRGKRVQELILLYQPSQRADPLPHYSRSAFATPNVKASAHG
jgi:hypothetical protein